MAIVVAELIVVVFVILAIVIEVVIEERVLGSPLGTLLLVGEVTYVQPCAGLER